MQIAITGATGFIGRYLAAELLQQGHQLRCWRRDTSKSPQPPRDTAAGKADSWDAIEWMVGHLNEDTATRRLVKGCDAVVHAALWRPGASFRGGEGDIIEFAEKNLIGSLKLIREAIDAGVTRFVFISTCAVHEKILDDRLLDEAHPLWPLSHYGAHKAAIEKFVHSYGFGGNFPICALRPTGVYGMADPSSSSKWFDLISQVAAGKPVQVAGGGKEVHAADVAKAARILLETDQPLHGEAYNCYDMYISQHAVATVAKQFAESQSEIIGEPRSPKHQISTEKIRQLGMEFGGEKLLRQYIQQQVQSIQQPMQSA